MEPLVLPSEAHDLTHIEQNIRSRLNGRVMDLKLMALDDGLVLRGSARTYYTKQLAQHAVMEFTKLPILENEIEVAWGRFVQPSK
jgi:hypothetical protein